MTIEHQPGPSGDLYAMPKKKKVEEGQQELTQEKKATDCPVPDKKQHKFKSGNVSVKVLPPCCMGPNS